MIHNISSSDFSSDGSYTFQLPANHNQISLVLASIPKSFYTVVSPYNTFKLDNTTYTLTQKNYSYSTFVSSINSLIAPASISFDTSTGKITLTDTTHTTLSFPKGSLMYRQFGFNINSTNGIVSTSLTSVNTCNFQCYSFVQIGCDTVKATSSTRPILGRIFIENTPDFGYIQYRNFQIKETARNFSTTSGSYSENTSNIIPRVAKFQILDQDYNPINLNGIPYDLTVLTFEKENYWPVIKQYMSFVLARHVEQNKLQTK
jgi:hypothetical protein